MPVSVPANARPWRPGDIWDEGALPTKAAPRSHSNLPVMAGVCVIGSGILAVINGLYSIIYTRLPIEFEQLRGLVDTCSVIIMLLGVIAIIGGSFAISRKNFTVSLIGAIMGLMTFSFVVGAILGLVGVILIAVSHDEFE